METCCIRNDSLNYNKIKHCNEAATRTTYRLYTGRYFHPFITTYFSAFWRRLVLENKLIPDSTGYIGEKFNHFLPNSIGIKPIIEYLVSTPDLLWWAMVIFTIIEGVVGLLYMLGFLPD